jgi:hypothetical protein
MCTALRVLNASFMRVLVLMAATLLKIGGSVKAEISPNTVRLTSNSLRVKPL